MKYRKIHCFFERSGNCKNALKELTGSENIFDYDITKTPEVDYQIDLFNEIENGFLNIDIKQNDLIIAFFPCTYFSTLNYLVFLRLTPEEKQKRKNKQKEYFYKLQKLCDFCNNNKIDLLIENPDHGNYINNKINQLKMKKLSISDRTAFGDQFIKSTQFLYNFDLAVKFPIIELNTYTKTKKIKETHGFERSTIEPLFFKNFFNTYIDLVI